MPQKDSSKVSTKAPAPAIDAARYTEIAKLIEEASQDPEKASQLVKDSIVAEITASCKVEDGHWIWTRDMTGGYPHIHYKGKNSKAIDVVFQYLKREPEIDEVVYRVCDKEACVCPDHLVALNEENFGLYRLAFKMSGRRTIGVPSPAKMLAKRDKQASKKESGQVKSKKAAA